MDCIQSCRSYPSCLDGVLNEFNLESNQEYSFQRGGSKVKSKSSRIPKLVRSIPRILDYNLLDETEI